MVKSLNCLASCVHDHMLGYIREAKTPTEAGGNLKKIFVANTTTRKLQLCQELNNIQQRDMSITSYTLKIKELCDSLGSISVNVDDEEMVQICLGDLAPRFGAMRTAVLAREKPPSFFDLQSMLLVEENHVRTRSNASEGHMLYTHSNGGRGWFGQGRGRWGPTYENNSQFRQENGNPRGTFERRGSFHLSYVSLLSPLLTHTHTQHISSVAQNHIRFFTIWYQLVGLTMKATRVASGMTPWNSAREAWSWPNTLYLMHTRICREEVNVASNTSNDLWQKRFYHMRQKGM